MVTFHPGPAGGSPRGQGASPEPGLVGRSLTTKQLALLEFIRRYIEDHRRSPLIREVQTGCDITSYKSAIDRLNALERKGLIRRVPNKHRGIKLIRKSPEPAAAPAPAAAPTLETAGEGLVPS